MRTGLRVAMLCHGTHGGSSVVACELATGLVERGHRVHVFAGGEPPRLSVAAAGVRVRAAEERRALTRRRIEVDLGNAIEAYRSLRDRSAFLEDNSLAASPNILDIAQVAYDAGEMTLVELLDAADALRNARMAEARLGADLWIAVYDLERAQGGLDAAAPQQATSTGVGR